MNEPVNPETRLMRELFAAHAAERPAPSLEAALLATARQERHRRQRAASRRVLYAAAAVAVAAAVLLVAGLERVKQDWGTLAVDARRSATAGAASDSSGGAPDGRLGVSSALPVSERPAVTTTVSAAAPEPKPCLPTTFAALDAPLIDDLTDGNARLLPLSGRDGRWFGQVDDSPDGERSVAPVLRTIDGKRSPVLDLSAPRTERWGVAFGALLVERGCHDLSAWGGVRFLGKGPVQLLVGVQTHDVVPLAEGGSCPERCHDNHVVRVQLGTKLEEHTVRWEQLSQRGYGQPVPFDPRRARAIVFIVEAADTPAKLQLGSLALATR